MAIDAATVCGVSATTRRLRLNAAILKQRSQVVADIAQCRVIRRQAVAGAGFGHL